MQNLLSSYLNVIFNMLACNLFLFFFFKGGVCSKLHAPRQVHLILPVQVSDYSTRQNIDKWEEIT